MAEIMKTWEEGRGEGSRMCVLGERWPREFADDSDERRIFVLHSLVFVLEILQCLWIVFKRGEKGRKGEVDGVGKEMKKGKGQGGEMGMWVWCGIIGMT